MDLTLEVIIGAASGLLGGVLIGFLHSRSLRAANRSLKEQLAEAEARAQYLAGEEYRKKEIGGFLFETFSRLGSGSVVREALMAAVEQEPAPADAANDDL